MSRKLFLQAWLATLTSIFFANSAHATSPMDDSIGSPCTPSPIVSVCRTKDDQYAFAFYDTRAHNLDYYDGLGETTFCQTGHVKIKGQKLKPSDFKINLVVSNDRGISVLDPLGKKQNPGAVVKLALTVSDLPKALNVYQVWAYEATDDKTATLYLFGAGSEKPTKINLDCYP